MLNFFIVFLGGGLGSICRYGIAIILADYKFTFPWATFLANVISCIILGLLVGLSLKQDVSNMQRLMLMTGFCGGFSTFSTFSNEAFQLFQSGHFIYAFTNILLSLVVCLSCIFLGIKVVNL